MIFSVVAISAFLFLAGGLAAMLLSSVRGAIAWFAVLPVLLALGWLGLWDDPHVYRVPREYGLSQMMDAIGLSIIAGHVCAAFACWLLWQRLTSRSADGDKPQ
jgi:UDP-N-acetylmuramyl pentapeptide phosphotransferase/UDP-N-acetylglucosamine-1-phosphate transferase